MSKTKRAAVQGKRTTRTTRSSGNKLIQDPSSSTPRLAAQLRALGLYAAPTVGDGNCLFRALSDQYYGSESRFGEVRRDVCDWIEAHRERYEGFVDVDEFGHGADDDGRRGKKGISGMDGYLRGMRANATYGGHMELSAFAHLANRNIKVVQPGLVYVIQGSPNTSSGTGKVKQEEPDDPWAAQGDEEGDKQGGGDTLYVAYHDWEHFSSIRNLRGPHAGLPCVREAPGPEADGDGDDGQSVASTSAAPSKNARKRELKQAMKRRPITKIKLKLPDPPPEEEDQRSSVSVDMGSPIAAGWDSSVESRSTPSAESRSTPSVESRSTPSVESVSTPSVESRSTPSAASLPPSSYASSAATTPPESSVPPSSSVAASAMGTPLPPSTAGTPLPGTPRGERSPKRVLDVDGDVGGEGGSEEGRKRSRVGSLSLHRHLSEERNGTEGGGGGVGEEEAMKQRMRAAYLDLDAELSELSEEEESVRPSRAGTEDREQEGDEGEDEWEEEDLDLDLDVAGGKGDRGKTKQYRLKSPPVVSAGTIKIPGGRYVPPSTSSTSTSSSGAASHTHSQSHTHSTPTSTNTVHLASRRATRAAAKAVSQKPKKGKASMGTGTVRVKQEEVEGTEWTRNGIGRVDVRGFRELKI